jgi:limonene-1,2-epoxide hydrolase
MTSSQAGGVDFDKLFVSIDSMDTEGFLSFIAADATFRYGSSPAVHGHDTIREALNGFFSSIAALSHKVHRFIADGNAVVCEGEVTYTRHLPFANIFEVDKGLISLYRIYIDIGPLYAA